MTDYARSGQWTEGLPLRGKIALVTGGGRGIGRAIATRLAQSGADVAVNDLGTTDVADEVRSIGRRAMDVPGDVGDHRVVAAIVSAVSRELGGIDILVNNAGVFRFRPFLEVTDEDLLEVLRIDLAGPFYCSQEVARDMIAHGRGGRIVMVSSVSAHAAQPTKSHYGAAKAGLEHLARTMAVELAPYQITVNSVAPGGPIVTDPAEAEALGFEETVKRRVPLGRAGRPDEVAAAVNYLVSAEAAYVTGATLMIDGGLFLATP